MRRTEYENVCRAIQAGEEKQVKHIVTHQIGKVLACHPEDREFEVDVSGEHKTWIAENCKEEQ